MDWQSSGVNHGALRANEADYAFKGAKLQSTEDRQLLKWSTKSTKEVPGAGVN